MSTSRIFLTGGTGFFGRALLRHFIAANMDCHVCVLSRNPDRFQAKYPELCLSKKITFVQGDIECSDSLPWNESFTHVLHAAADSTNGPYLPPLHRYNQIVAGTTNILEFSVKKSVLNFLFVSSGGIYGSHSSDAGLYFEEHSGAPPLDEVRAAYSHGKRAAEYLCALYSESFGLNYTVARCFSFVGPDLPLDAHFAIGNFLNDALNSDVLSVRGDGSPVRSYLDQRDLALWLWTLLFSGRRGEAYNVGSEDAISILDLAYLIRDTLAPDKEVFVHGMQNSIGYRGFYVPSIQKIKDHLGLVPNYTLVESIRQCVL